MPSDQDRSAAREAIIAEANDCLPRAPMRLVDGCHVEYGDEVRPGVYRRLTLDDLAELAMVVPKLLHELATSLAEVEKLTKERDDIVRERAVQHQTGYVTALRGDVLLSATPCVDYAHRVQQHVMRLEGEVEKLRASLSAIAGDEDSLPQCLVARFGEGTVECSVERVCVACRAAMHVEKLRTELAAIDVAAEAYGLFKPSRPEDHDVHRETALGRLHAAIRAAHTSQRHRKAGE